MTRLTIACAVLISSLCAHASDPTPIAVRDPNAQLGAAHFRAYPTELVTRCHSFAAEREGFHREQANRSFCDHGRIQQLEYLIRRSAELNL